MILAPAAGLERRSSLLASYAAGLARLTERGLAEVAIERGRALARVDATIRAVVQQSFDGIVVFDAMHRVVMANEAAATIFAVRTDQLVGTGLERLFSDLDPPSTLEAMGALGAGEEQETGRRECRGRRGDGSSFPAELSLCRISVEGQPQLVATVRDVSERYAHESRLRHQATHDALTDLANRALLQSTLQGDLGRLAAEGGRLALLLLDLDRFKEVNDTLGHQVGDLLLIDVARRLRQAVRGRDLVARLGGDEFAVLLRDDPELDDVLEVARRVVETIQQPFELGDLAVTDIDASVGVALAPEHSSDTVDLLRCADVAMYAAKSGTSPIEVYRQDKDPHCRRRLVASTAIRRAIRNDEFALVYQPQFCLRTGDLVGAEALLRWEHPEHGAIAPTEFIAVAEQTGSIVQLTHWIMDTALDQLAHWCERGLEIAVAVNVAARSLHDDRLLDLVLAKMTRLRLPPRLLTLELTERGVIAGTETIARVLGRLGQFGVRLSVDDFGTGYSSLALLQRLSVHELKIDPSFVAGMMRNEQDRVLVRSTVELAHNLGLIAVAEGIETEEQLDQLRAIGCNGGQGYLLGRPVGAEELERAGAAGIFAPARVAPSAAVPTLRAS
jgi:diguanylate cyclase (GGDEF)-like protein/PAS domain S-box-containing protein